MAQKKNFTHSKGNAAPSCEVGAPTRSYGTKAARNNMQPQGRLQKGK